MNLLLVRLLPPRNTNGQDKWAWRWLLSWYHKEPKRPFRQASMTFINIGHRRQHVFRMADSACLQPLVLVKKWNQYFEFSYLPWSGLTQIIFKKHIKTYEWRPWTPPSTWADIVLFSNFSSPEYIMALVMKKQEIIDKVRNHQLEKTLHWNFCMQQNRGRHKT